MDPKKLDKIIGIVKTLQEDAAIANSLSGGKIAGTVEAGDNPPVDLRKGRRRNWNPFFKNLAKTQRRKPQ
jgi:hypothetical protein